MLRIFFYGDYALDHPDHHGTPMERVSAITGGFDLAVDNLDAVFRAGHSEAARDKYHAMWDDVLPRRHGHRVKEDPRSTGRDLSPTHA